MKFLILRFLRCLWIFPVLFPVLSLLFLFGLLLIFFAPNFGFAAPYDSSNQGKVQGQDLVSKIDLIEVPQVEFVPITLGSVNFSLLPMIPISITPLEVSVANSFAEPFELTPAKTLSSSLPSSSEKSSSAPEDLAADVSDLLKNPKLTSLLGPLTEIGASNLGAGKLVSALLADGDSQQQASQAQNLPVQNLQPQNSQIILASKIQTSQNIDIAYHPLSIFNSVGGLHQFAVQAPRKNKQKQQGLMFRTVLADDAGMLFLYSHPRIITMWMENTYISLDMIFIAPDDSFSSSSKDNVGVIVHIARNTTPLSRANISTTKKAIAVLEIKAGLTQKLNINIGDRIEWNLTQTLLNR